MSYQIVIIQGNMTKDATSRQVGQNTVISLSVATSRKYKKADGTFGEDTEFHDVELWNQPNVFPYLKKGTAVLIQGEIKTDRWVDQNGQDRISKKIRASVLTLVGGRPQGAAQSAPQAAPAPQAPVAPTAPATASPEPEAGPDLPF